MSLQRSKERFPIWVHKELDDLGLDPFVLSVYIHLSRRANGTGKAWPSRQSIAEHCGISERQVTRCIQVLEAECLVVVVRENNSSEGGRRNTYYLTATDDWLRKAAEKHMSQGDCEAPSERAKLPEDASQGACRDLLHITEGKPVEGKPIVVPEARQKATKGKKAPDPKSFLAMFFPDEFRHDDDFVAAWDGWGQNRIEAKNPLNERSAKIAANKLVNYPIKIAIEALDRSTLSGWTGVFPESVGKGPNGGKYQAASDTQPKQDFGF